MKIVNQRTVKRGKYCFSSGELLLPSSDLDLHIKLPDGRECVFQWRIEHGTIDLCLMQNGRPLTQGVHVTDADLKSMLHENEGQQITICGIGLYQGPDVPYHSQEAPHGHASS